MTCSKFYLRWITTKILHICGTNNCLIIFCSQILCIALLEKVEFQGSTNTCRCIQTVVSRICSKIYFLLVQSGGLQRGGWWATHRLRYLPASKNPIKDHSTKTCSLNLSLPSFEARHHTQNIARNSMITNLQPSL